MKPDHQVSIDFLKDLNPDGPWNLVAITPDHVKTDEQQFALSGATFHTEDEKGMELWLKAHPKDNIYYTLNPILRDIKSKPSRRDIKSMAWLHVDLDPRPREDVAAEQKRILAQCEAMEPKPTKIIFSGGGYQALWRLDDPFEINGQESKFEEAKLYNLQLEIQFEADHCHNVDRILRLPGTINWPNARKREKGREPALAAVVVSNDVSYPLASFAKAAQHQSAPSISASKHTVSIETNVPRMDDINGLDVSALCRTVISQGKDPDDPGRWESRSEPLFWVVCEMVRSGIDDQTIYSIITDPDWLISGHVLDQTRPEDYAIRQIERAKDEDIDPLLTQLNDQFACVMNAGKTVIMVEKKLPNGDTDISYSTFSDFHNFYGNKRVEYETPDGKTASKPVGMWWTSHEHRRSYDGLVFSPGKEVPGHYNLWTGFRFEALPGDCSLYLKHTLVNICSSNKDHYDYLVGWMAQLVQKPHLPAQTAIVLRGKPGTGKGRFVETLGDLFGQHFLAIRDAKHMIGRFTQHLERTVLLFADEAFVGVTGSGSESILKGLITERDLLIEGKGTTARVQSNCLHLILAGNDDYVVPVGSFDRRFFVLDVGEGSMQDRTYFEDMDRQMQAGGYAALLHHLMTYDISTYDVTKVPSTRAHMEQKMRTLKPIDEWWYAKLQDGCLIGGEWPEKVWAMELQTDLVEYLKQFNSRGDTNSSKLGKFLCKVMQAPGTPGSRFRKQSGCDQSVMQPNGEMRRGRHYFYEVPALADAREFWITSYGATKWEDAAEVVDLPQHEENF